MSSPSHEHLLGYVLGALEPWEHEQLERELANDPQLARQAEVLAARLHPLDSFRLTEAAPVGLASRTCSLVFEQAEAAKVAPARRLTSTDYGDESSRWSLTDLGVAAGIFVAAGLLFFPAIANSRYQAQQAQCQNNLRHVGEAYSLARNAHPEIDYNNPAAMKGNRAVAGIQPVLLHDQGYLDRPSALICPGSPLADSRKDWNIPGLRQIDNGQGAELDALQRQAAGSLAFSLGHRLQRDAVAPASDFLAIASDAPSGTLPAMVSSHHDGKGQNVLFDSGRIAYISGCGAEDCGDSLFWNRQLRVEAGLDKSDIVLAPGGIHPFGTPNLQIND